MDIFKKKKKNNPKFNIRKEELFIMDKDKEIEKLRKQDAENKKQFEEERLKKELKKLKKKEKKQYKKR
ncbi:hypothetical protein [Spiroplasma ixodetis]|uniref:hypothetical protein n=1 Tax=Spiroplasma ixodetis TaxID=2141 RepID=UPI00257739FD|nr:hypothetical protein [Spiroplasma ixodetis]WJG69805.1 hypothetical protein SIXOD_v1c07750 [Spiroplasma ixodetis Y32]